jgi:hypothetical protein
LCKINSGLGIAKIEADDIKKPVPPEYHKFIPLFSEVIANKLPPTDLTMNKTYLKKALKLGGLGMKPPPC